MRRLTFFLFCLLLIDCSCFNNESKKKEDPLDVPQEVVVTFVNKTKVNGLALYYTRSDTLISCNELIFFAKLAPNAESNGYIISKGETHRMYYCAPNQEFCDCSYKVLNGRKNQTKTVVIK